MVHASEADGVSLDQKISGCTTVIQSGKISNSDLALAYTNRGFAYGTKGQHDRAIQDYDQAIKLNPSNAKRAIMNRVAIRVPKRSVVLFGPKTSVSLEEPFWQALREIASEHEMTTSALLNSIASNAGNIRSLE